MSRLGIVLRRTGIICAFVGWFSSSAAADPIRLFVDRSIFGIAQASDETGFDSAEDTLGNSQVGLFDVELAAQVMVPTLTASFSVAQKTDISASHWFGSGRN